MDISQDTMQLRYKDGNIRVQRLLVANQTIYRVIFPGQRAPLVLTRVAGSNADFFWTSIPEGRQPEAEEIGLLIESNL